MTYQPQQAPPPYSFEPLGQGRPTVPRRRRPRWPLALAGGALAVLVIAGVWVGVTLAGSDRATPPSTPTGQPIAGQGQAPPSARLTAAQMVERLSALYPLPNPTDNTAGCAPACVQQITTDAVTVTEFGDPASAARWVSEMKGDYRRAGQFVLSWTARDQDYTDQDARAAMLAEAERLAGA